MKAEDSLRYSIFLLALRKIDCVTLCTESQRNRVSFYSFFNERPRRDAAEMEVSQRLQKKVGKYFRNIPKVAKNS
jgi:hypothetical protein